MGEVLRAFPDSAANQLALGVLLARQGRYDAAIAEWAQERRLDISAALRPAGPPPTIKTS